MSDTDPWDSIVYELLIVNSCHVSRSEPQSKARFILLFISEKRRNDFVTSEHFTIPEEPDSVWFPAPGTGMTSYCRHYRAETVFFGR